MEDRRGIQDEESSEGRRFDELYVIERPADLRLKESAWKRFDSPTDPEDCYTALLWLVERAGELGVDPLRVSVGGGSAGGPGRSRSPDPLCSLPPVRGAMVCRRLRSAALAGAGSRSVGSHPR